MRAPERCPAKASRLRAEPRDWRPLTQRGGGGGEDSVAGGAVAGPRSGPRCGRAGGASSFPPGEAGSGGHVGTASRAMWRPLRLSRCLAVVPSAPRSKSCHIIVKAASRPPAARGRKGGPPRAKLELQERPGTTGGMGELQKKVQWIQRKDQKVQPGTTGYIENG